MAKYIITEYQRQLFHELLTESIQQSTPQTKAALIAAGNDANLVVDQDGYEFIFEILTSNARKVFSGTEWADRSQLTPRDIAMDKLIDKIRAGGLKVHYVKKASPVVVTGFAGKKYPTVGLPAGGEDLRNKIRNVKITGKNNAFDVRQSADVKIDTHVYDDGDATYVIKPLSARGKKFLPNIRTVKQDEMQKIKRIFSRENIKIITEEIDHR